MGEGECPNPHRDGRGGGYGEAETRTFGQLDWRHLNGSQAGTVLSPGWIIGEGEPPTLRLEGLPRERVLRLQAGGGSARRRWT